jgi:hypothetical protein
MTHHDAPNDELRDRAFSAVLGLLSEHEAGAFARHVSQCDVCRLLEREARDSAFDLALSAPPVAPPDSLRSRLQAAIAPPVQSWKQWTSDAAGDAQVPFAYAFAGDAVWEPTGTPGVETRKLFVDAANDRVAMLIRMAAGTSYPGHTHSAPEDCFVLEGDLYAHDFEMKAGDYRRASAGSTDPVQATRGGCVLFILSSLHDELHDSPGSRRPA